MTSRVTFQADYHHAAIKRAPDVGSPLGQEMPGPARSVSVLQKAGWTPRPVTGPHSWSKEAPRSQVASMVPSPSWAHFSGRGPCPRGMFLHPPVSGTVPAPCSSRYTPSSPFLKLRNCCRAGGGGSRPLEWDSGLWLPAGGGTGT